MTHSELEGHTQKDYDHFIANDIDPSTRQPREHSVPCTVCRKDTFNVAVRCDSHYAILAHSGSV